MQVWLHIVKPFRAEASAVPVMIGDGCFVATAPSGGDLPANVRVFGEHAFSFCQELRSITFEGECPAFGGECFVACSDDLTLYVPDDQLEAYQEQWMKSRIFIRSR